MHSFGKANYGICWFPKHLAVFRRMWGYEMFAKETAAKTICGWGTK